MLESTLLLSVMQVESVLLWLLPLEIKESSRCRRVRGVPAINGDDVADPWEGEESIELLRGT